jgi:enediyne biosynthesis protein E4
MYIYSFLDTVNIIINITSWLVLLLFAGLSACHPPDAAHPEQPAFKVIGHTASGLDFSNKLLPSKKFSIFDYMYFYNGAGVGAGDFNNDGRIDLFFASNQGDNKLYLNKGDLQFEDITAAADIPLDSGWSTGVSVVDINNDGLLDIYICKVGKLEGLPVTHNQLLGCQGIDKEGIPHYKDKAKEYGLDFSGFSTQAVFFDYDGDGDLDMYLLNHSIYQNGSFGPRQDKLATFSPLSGDRLYRNEGNGKFTDQTKTSGIHSSIIGYGLGVAVSDIDLDGYPDIYIGNDFYENDYLYINQHNGQFRDELADHIMHTSQFSMGVDIADINNDGYPDILSTDMLPYDPYILKRSAGEDSWDILSLKIGYGYNYQYTRNNLQLNRRNGMFSESGLYSGVAATDWSWSPLFMDFDNDGLKDLFIANGIPKRLNDIDYINFISNQELNRKIQNNAVDPKDIDQINTFPEVRLPSKFFRNEGQLGFSDLAARIDGSTPSYSNGAICADLDNDGDMDIVASNIDAPAMLYLNTANDKKDRPYLDIRLKGSEKNINALGAKLIVFANGNPTNGNLTDGNPTNENNAKGEEIRTYEKYPVHGFLSSMEIPLHVGLFHTQVDSAFMVWPDNTYQRVNLQPEENTRSDHRVLTLIWKKGLPPFDYKALTRHNKNATRPVRDITTSTGLLHRHKENDFHEFDREPLIPHMLSTEGPALAVADIDKDGLEDVFIGASKDEKSSVFRQLPSGKFTRITEPDLDKDSGYEDTYACWADIDHDGSTDLVVASGGNEYGGNDPHLLPRIYRNDGKGHLKRQDQAFGNVFVNASCVTAADINGDGYTDLFIGGRSVPFRYGQTPRSYLLINDGRGKFIDLTDQLAPGLSDLGFVTSAQWFDLDKDGQKDLLLSLEWGGIVAFMNNHGRFTKKILTDKKGWWNFILPVDLGHDGNVDLIVGNLGLNSRLKASDKEPIRLYYNDFDDNGIKEQILTYYLDGRELPFANKDDLERQIPGLKKSFLYAQDFAKATLRDLFSADKLGSSDTLSANYFSNAILVNKGHLNFSLEPLPWQAQLSTYRDAVIVDANGDQFPDILLVGNYYDNNIGIGRNDADFGTLLINNGRHSFSTSTLNGLAIKGQVRHIRPIGIGGQPSFILVRNNDSTMIIRFGH